MLQDILRILKLPVVRQKILFTLLIIAFFRFISSFTIPGVNKDVIAAIVSSNELLQVVNLMSGGLFLTLSILSVGLGPYITASYIFQILGFAFPTIKEMFQGGPIERKMLTTYMRWATFPIAVLQSAGFLIGINQISASVGLPPLVEFRSGLQLLATIMILVFGAYVTMWLGELITQYGLGGGSSVIIMIGILASFPATLGGSFKLLLLNWQKVLYVLGILGVTVLSIIVTLAVRKIAVVHAQRVRATGMTGVTNHIFIPVNPGGVMPVIFAVATVSFVGTIVQFLLRYPDKLGRVWDIVSAINIALNDVWISNGLLFSLTLGFTYFSALLVLSPKNIAENLQKQGAFIPGVRPGKETEQFLTRILKRRVLIGGVLLGIITVLPSLVRFAFVNTPLIFFGLGISGTAILIVVAVFIDIIRQLRSVQSTTFDVKKYI